MAFVDRPSKVNVGENLPNLTIEIENDVEIAMETDEECSNSSDKAENKSVQDEAEEGELVDCKDEGLEDPVFDEPRPLMRPKFPLNAPRRPMLNLLDEDVFITGPASEKRFENRAGGFVTGVNIFSPEEQEKLTKRAERFGIDPSESKPLTQKLLKSLYKSMGVTGGDVNIRFDTLHLRGTEEMTSQDVFGYFKDYAPASIEWLTSSSCNVMWLDEISAARALLGLSVKIRNLQRGATGQQGERRNSKDDEDGDVIMEEKKNSIADDRDGNSEDSDGAISVSEINVSVPPGLWRKGVSSPKSECLLLRFATRQDRRVTPATRLNSQEFNGYTGLISESRKRRFQESFGGIVFYDTGDEVLEKSGPVDASNPWASLAHSWGAFDRNRNKNRGPESPPKRPTPPPSPVLMSRHHHPHFFNSRGPPGFLRRDDLFDVKKRRPRNGERGSCSSNNSEEEDLDNNDDDWGKRRKIPRMRMHADDEVVLLEKRLSHSRSKRRKSTSDREHRTDLRKRLYEKDMLVIKRERSESPRREESDQEAEEEEVPDLRVAIVADPPRSRSPSPEDRKENILRLGQVKSVLRGARAHDSCGSDDDRMSAVRSSVRKHRSRSKERHQRRRRRKEEESTRRRGDKSKERRTQKEQTAEEYDSDEVAVQPNARDLRAKLGKKRKKRTRDDGSPFRPRSPLQIEIDNDEYYKLIESD